VTCSHEIYSRYLGSETDADGDEYMIVGCRDCEAVARFASNAKLARLHNQALEIIRSSGAEGIQAAAIEERLGCSHGHVVRILKHLCESEAIVRLSRGWYAAPPSDFNPHEKIENLEAHFALCNELRIAKP
jgi:hypothetical protein